MSNKETRDGGQPSRAGQTDAGKHLYRNHTTRVWLRQLAERAAENARRCERNETKRKFESLASFLERCARGGVK
jgi:hypothetical protein